MNKRENIKAEFRAHAVASIGLLNTHTTKNNMYKQLCEQINIKNVLVILGERLLLALSFALWHVPSVCLSSVSDRL